MCHYGIISDAIHLASPLTTFPNSMVLCVRSHSCSGQPPGTNQYERTRQARQRVNCLLIILCYWLEHPHTLTETLDSDFWKTQLITLNPNWNVSCKVPKIKCSSSMNPNNNLHTITNQTAEAPLSTSNVQTLQIIYGQATSLPNPHLHKSAEAAAEKIYEFHKC